MGCGLMKDPGQFREDRRAYDGKSLRCRDCLAPPEKACARCLGVKSAARFRADPRNADGRHSWCHDCEAESKREHDARPAVKAARREYEAAYLLRRRELRRLRAARRGDEGRRGPCRGPDQHGQANGPG